MRGRSRLQLSQVEDSLGATCTPEASSGVCTFPFRIYLSDFHGVDVEVMQLSVGEVTQNPANDLGEAGFEFPVAIVVPAPKRHR